MSRICRSVAEVVSSLVTSRSRKDWAGGVPVLAERGLGAARVVRLSSQ